MLDLLIINFLILFLSLFCFDNRILIINIYKKKLNMEIEAIIVNFFYKIVTFGL